MKAIEKFRTKFEDIMSAVTFAEAGEFETARLIMNNGEGRQERITRRIGSSVRPKMMTKRARK